MNKQVTTAELNLKTGVPGGDIPKIGIEPHGDNTAQEQLGATGTDRPSPVTAGECENCGNGFEPRKGGKPQRFCSETCRMAFHAEVREAGKAVTEANRATCTLQTVTTPLLEPKPGPAPTGEDFDWADDESVILREQPETAAYFNREGGLVIRQHRWPDDDTVVVIARNCIADFLDKLTDICGVPSVGRA
jgi:hypothetical protein